MSHAWWRDCDYELFGRLTKERDEMKRRLAVELVDVSMERTWCRECRTEDFSRKRDRTVHPHTRSCLLYSEGRR